MLQMQTRVVHWHRHYKMYVLTGTHRSYACVRSPH